MNKLKEQLAIQRKNIQILMQMVRLSHKGKINTAAEAHEWLYANGYNTSELAKKESLERAKKYTDAFQSSGQHITGINIGRDPIAIKHSALEHVDDSAYVSNCPICIKGLLLIARDQQTGELAAEDICLVCMQTFIYTDIDKLRKKDNVDIIVN